MSDAVISKRQTTANFNQIFSVWVLPEIDRRIRAGTLPNPIDIVNYLNLILIVFNTDRTCRVLFNNQVEFINPEAPTKQLKVSNIDPNAGYMLLIKNVDNTFSLKFDTRRYVETAGTFLKVADEFLESAEFALSKNHLHSFLDNLFSSAELLIKIGTMLLADRDTLEATKHTHIKARANKWSARHIEARSLVQVYNKLLKLRPKFRYLQQPLSISQPECVKILNDIKRFRLYIGPHVTLRF